MRCKKLSHGLGIFSLLLANQACVTTEPTDAATAKAGYQVVCDPRADLSSSEFKVVRCSFTNATAQDLQLHVASVGLLPTKLDNEIAKPETIDRYRRQLAERETPLVNSQLAAIGSMLAATAVGAAGGRAGTGAGAAAVVGGVSAVGLAGAGRSGYGAGHLLGPAFTVPPSGAVQKLLLVQAPVETLRPEGMKLCLDAPDKSCFDLYFGDASRARAGSW